MNFTLLHLLILRCGIHVRCYCLKNDDDHLEGKGNIKRKTARKPVFADFLNRLIDKMDHISRSSFSPSPRAVWQSKCGRFETQNWKDDDKAGHRCFLLDRRFCFASNSEKKKIFDLSRYQLRLEFIIFFRQNVIRLALRQVVTQSLRNPTRDVWLAFFCAENESPRNTYFHCTLIERKRKTENNAIA